MIQRDFGIITACHAGDYCMVKATCASIRHFCGDVPICVIADGRFSTDELVRAYGVQVLHPQNMRDPVAREICCAGGARPKHMAMWEGPFERFLYLDADAIFWGDVLSTFDPGEADFFALRPCPWKDLTLETIKHVYLDPDLLRDFDPDFRWQTRPYFCAGAFVARRGILCPRRWVAVEQWRRERPGLFSWTTDQGILNYLILSMADRGEIEFRELALQVTLGDRPTEEMVSRFPCNVGRPPRVVERPWILHFCGNKPLLQYPKAFQRPFLAFRLLHYRNLFGHHAAGRALAWSAVLRDEATVFRRRLNKKLRRMMGREALRMTLL